MPGKTFSLALFVIMFSAFVCLYSAMADDLVGEGTSTVLDLNQQPWFKLRKTKIADEAAESYLIEFVDAKGVVLSEERVKLSLDRRIISYDWNFHQLKNRYEVRVEGRSVKMLANESGKASKKEFSLSEDEIKRATVPPLLADSIRWNWQSLEKTGSHEIVLFVPDRRDYFRFRFVRQADKSEFVFSAVNPFLRLLVDPITLVFSKAQELCHVKGATVPVQYVGAKGKLEEKITDIRFPCK